MTYYFCFDLFSFFFIQYCGLCMKFILMQELLWSVNPSSWFILYRILKHVIDWTLRFSQIIFLFENLVHSAIFWLPSLSESCSEIVMWGTKYQGPKKWNLRFVDCTSWNNNPIIYEYYCGRQIPRMLVETKAYYFCSPQINFCSLSVQRIPAN